MVSRRRREAVRPEPRERAAAQRSRCSALFAEHQIYRIDHYLGKETVQNVLVLRFANSIFEPLWNRQWIHHVQITAAETVGVEERGKYYEEAGVVRDMFQNHLLQLLTLTAMEPPPQMSANAVRDEKVKVLQVDPLAVAGDDSGERRARAVHGRARSNGKPVPGYIEEPTVAPDSHRADVRRGAALRRQLALERRAVLSALGKRLKKRVSEIAVQFRAPPHLMFGHGGDASCSPNTLVMRVQPNEGVSLNFEVKVPGAAVALTSNIEIAPVDMDFDYAEAFGEVGGAGVRDAAARRDDRRGDAVHAQRRGRGGVARDRSADQVLGDARAEADADVRRRAAGGRARRTS